MTWRVILLVIGCSLPSGMVAAHSPDEVNGPWYNSLRVPGTNGTSSCCGYPADCGPVNDDEVKIDQGVYWVRNPVSGQFLKVPPEAIDHRMDNPTGHYVACIYDER